MSRCLTRVALVFVPDRFNAWLRFGRPHEVRNLDEERRHAYFVPGSLFAYARWSANSYGTLEWTLLVLSVCLPGERVLRLSGIKPGAEVLLRVAGRMKVRRALALIDAIEAEGIRAEEVSPAYWRAVHGRFAANLDAHVYGRAQHQAFLQRAALL